MPSSRTSSLAWARDGGGERAARRRCWRARSWPRAVRRPAAAATRTSCWCRSPPSAGCRRWSRGPTSSQDLPSSAPPRLASPSSALLNSLGTIHILLASPWAILRQRLQVLVGQQALVGLAVVDRLEHRLDRLRLALRLQEQRGALTLGAQDPALPLGLGLEDRGLLLALRGEDRRGLLALGGGDRRLPGALGGQDDRALVAVGAHLLLHRVADGDRRVDRLDLDARHPQAPRPGRAVEDLAQLAVDAVAAGQRALEVQPTDDVAQRRRRQLLHAGDVVRDAVDGQPRVGHLEVQDGVDADLQVVGGDHRLRREGDDLLAQVDGGPHPVDERHQDRQARARACGCSGPAARSPWPAPAERWSRSWPAR